MSSAMLRRVLAAMLCGCAFTGVRADEPVGFNLEPYKAAAKRIETAVLENDAKTFPELFDTAEFVRRVFRPLPDTKPEFRRGFEKPISGLGRQVLTEWANAVLEGGNIKLLSVRMVDGEPRGVVRVLTKHGLNYVDLIFSTDGGRPRMVDAYVAISGERLSEMGTRYAAMSLSELDGVGGEGLLVHSKTMEKIFVLSKSNLPKEALAALETLPSKLQREKTMQVVLIANRMKLHQEDPAAYGKAIDGFVELFPGDPAVDLITIDGYMLRKDYVGGIAALDRLDKTVGGDPYLNVLRTNFYMLQQKPAEARIAADKAVAEEPDLKQTHLVLADVALVQKDFKTLAKCLTTLEERFEMNFNGVATSAVFAPFRESREYRAWQAAREKRLRE